MSTSVSFNNVGFSFNGSGEDLICAGLDFRIEPETIVGIVGPSGVGKTTLLTLQAGLINPTVGEVKIGGYNPQSARKNGLIAYAPQRGALCTWLTAVENVELALRLCGIVKDISAKALKTLDAFGLSKDVGKYPQELSGGMQQRVILAMALAAGRQLVLLDEPFVALDSHTRYMIHQHLLSEWESLSQRPTMVIVSHDLNEAVFLCDKVLVIKKRPINSVTEVPIPLPRPRTQAMRYKAPFLESVKRIDEVLSLT